MNALLNNVYVLLEIIYSTEHHAKYCPRKHCSFLLPFILFCFVCKSRFIFSFLKNFTIFGTCYSSEETMFLRCNQGFAAESKTNIYTGI